MRVGDFLRETGRSKTLEPQFYLRCRKFVYIKLVMAEKVGETAELLGFAESCNCVSSALQWRFP